MIHISYICSEKSQEMKTILSAIDVKVEDMPSWGSKIAQAVPYGTTLLMEGDMGAGKTTLTKSIVEAMGCDDVVSSPTFSLVNQYLTRDGRSIYHFDFYRIDDIEEAYDMGCEEYFYSGETCIVEWGEKASELLPDDSWVVRIVKKENSRNIELICP